jgi:predicted TIM-barrel fold metal-dependent hydrolase
VTASTVGAVTTDFHVHCLAADMIPDEVHAARAMARRRERPTPEEFEKVIARSRSNSTDEHGKLLREDLEAAGFERALLIGLDWGLMGAATRATGPEAQLEWADAVVAEHETFFRFAFCVDPRRPNAPPLVRRALQYPWVAGIKLYPPTGFSPLDAACDPIYDAVAESGAFVLFHTGRSTYPFELERGRVEQYSTVQRKHPDMRIVLGHSGFPLWGTHAVTVASGHPFTYVEVSGWNRFMGEHDTEVSAHLRFAFQELGAHRVLFGSDHLSGPRFSGEHSTVREWRQRFEEEAAAAGVDASESEAAALGLLDREWRA